VFATALQKYLGDGEWEKLVVAPAGEVVEQVAAIAQRPVVPEVKAADPDPVTEPVADAEYFAVPSFEPEDDIEEEAAAPLAQPAAQQPAPEQPIQVTPGIVRQMILYAVQRLRRDGKHTQRRQSWIEGSDIPALVEELAQGRPVNEKFLSGVVLVLALQAIDACPPPHPRAAQIDLVERFVFSHLRETHPDDDDEAERLRQQVLAATTRDQILAALDAVTSDRSEFGRTDEAACTVIRSVIPGWEPVPVQVEADADANVQVEVPQITINGLLDEPSNLPKSTNSDEVDVDAFIREYGDRAARG